MKLDVNIRIDGVEGFLGGLDLFPADIGGAVK